MNKATKRYRSTEVFLFHKSNTRKFSCKCNCLPLSHLKMLSWCEFQSLLFQLSCNVRLCIIFDYLRFIPRHSVTATLDVGDFNVNLSTEKACCLTALGVPKGKRFTEHYSILAPEAVGFSQELLAQWAVQLVQSTEQMVKLSFIS